MFKTFWRHSQEKKWLLIITPILVMIEVIAELQQPKLLSQIINVFAQNGTNSIIWSTSLQMLAYLLLSVTTFLLSVYCASLVSAYLGKNLRQFLFQKIQSLSLTQIENLTPGALLTRLTNDINQAQNLLIQTLRMAIRAPLMFLGSLFFLTQINFQLLKIVLIVAPIILLIIIIIAKFALPLFQKLQKILDQLNNQMSESLNAIRTLKSFNQEQATIDKFNLINQQFRQFASKSAQIMAAAMPLMMFILNLAIAIILWEGAKLFQINQIAIGDLVAAIGYLSQLLFAFLMMSFIFINIMKTKVSITRINQLLELNSDLHLSQKNPNTTIANGQIEFKNVSFSYSKNNQLTLKKLNFTLAAGSSIGIIGVTGSGKSTIAFLLNRLYDPTNGEILIDGQNLKDYPLEEIKSKIILVSQQASLLSGTIADNLLWDEPITTKKIAQALKISQAKKFVNLQKKKLQAPVARQGTNFSGGEKQRLSLARALARNPKILILDDITSALDFKTAAKLQQALHLQTQSVTKIIISQRISNVRSCDQIIVIDQGMIQAIGTHSQLLTHNPIYQKINHLQSENNHA